MNYEAWRLSYQDSEQAAKAAYDLAVQRWQRIRELEEGVMVSVLPMEKLQERILELEAELAALRQQQGEPVAWRFKNNSGEAVTIWIDYVPQAIESAERQAREAGGWIEYAYNREAAPRVPEGMVLVPRAVVAALKDQDMYTRNEVIAMLSAAPQPPDCKSEIQSGDCDEFDNVKDIFSKP